MVGRRLSRTAQIAKSDTLRMPLDQRDQISYKPPMLGKTDRFVLVLRKI